METIHLTIKPQRLRRGDPVRFKGPLLPSQNPVGIVESITRCGATSGTPEMEFSLEVKYSWSEVFVEDDFIHFDLLGKILTSDSWYDD